MNQQSTYRVYGTTLSGPAERDWELILETTDAAQATQAVHETEGTFWRRLTEDDTVVLPRV